MSLSHLGQEQRTRGGIHQLFLNKFKIEKKNKYFNVT